MKARFSQPQLPVKTVAAGGKTYIFICLNETQGTESFPDIGEGQMQETYYEYDYNEIIGPTDVLPLEDIQSHPENYLDYVYAPEESEDPGTQALAETQELKAAIERGLTL